MDSETYTVLLLALRPDAPELDEEASAALQDAHVAYLTELHQERHVPTAGPLHRFQGSSTWVRMRLLQLQLLPIRSEVAQELSVNPRTMHSWVSRWRRHGSASSDRGRLREAERAELERLRRKIRRGRLSDEIRARLRRLGGTCGSPKVWITLLRKGWRVSVNTVAKLMAELGLAGRKIRRRGGLTRPGRRAQPLTSYSATSPPKPRTRCGTAT
jgi:transposase-like protein